MAKPKSQLLLSEHQRDKKKFKEEVSALASLVDQLAVFQEWKEIILPDLKDDLAAGKTAKELRAKWTPHLTAREISIGLTCPDVKTALSAIKDTVDREEGKAVERRDIRHQLENLPEEELTALLMTKLSDTEARDKKKIVN